MFDKFLVRDMDGDGDIDFIGTRGNSVPWGGVFWLEQVRTAEPVKSFERARRRQRRDAVAVRLRGLSTSGSVGGVPD